MLSQRIFIFTSLIGFVISLVLGAMWPIFYYLLFLIIPYALLGFYDLFFTTHNILRNYPVYGHLRYMFEFVRPEIQQYFVATNQSGRPFNRELRSVIYQRAKDVNDTLPFGTQQDIAYAGYDLCYHSLSPKEVPLETARLIIGGKACTRPYNASRLNISAMSYGALGHTAIEALNWGAKMGNFAHNTGEGGLTEYHLKHHGDIILQIGTGNFGFRNLDGSFNPDKFKEKALLDEIKMIEIKLSQGAKPSHGGLLPAAKISAEIAEIRGIPMGEDCLSPPTHPGIDTPLDLMHYIAQLRALSTGKPVGFKLCIGIKREFMALCKAMIETGIKPDFITVDGAEGGTGAAPLEYSNILGTPINEALNFVHNCLVGTGLRDDITLIASGKIATGFNMLHKMALGADACNMARPMMFAVGCIQALKCNTNECPTGVTTQDKRRNRAVLPEEKRYHVRNLQKNTIKSFLELTGAIGLKHPDQLGPQHVFHRLHNKTVCSYAELYPQLQPGELLNGSNNKLFASEWQAADAERFN